jgi:hypothetical protein
VHGSAATASLRLRSPPRTDATAGRTVTARGSPAHRPLVELDRRLVLYGTGLGSGGLLDPSGCALGRVADQRAVELEASDRVTHL